MALIALSLATGALVRAHPEELRAPSWVVYCALAAFAFAGLLLLAGSARPRTQSWLAVVMTIALVTPGAWVAFAPGERHCSTSIPHLTVASDTVCRTAFGLGTFFGALVLIFFTKLALDRR